jgi:DNA-binding CsgD family transcriptional regulator/tetratricopeptide (TPR) repeat protein
MSDAETGGSDGLVGRRLREAHFLPRRTLSPPGYVIDATGVGWWCGRMAGTGAFVGREGELSRLQSALAERARLVLVVGDAGIGKTRFVGEGLRRAAAGGMVAVGGGCLPLAEKLPLLPVADALAELSRLDGGRPFGAALEVAPAYVRPEVARLLPRLGAGEPEPTGPAEGWRHERLFAAVAELLGGVARRSAVVLLIEDVHWADAATLDLLTYLVRAGRGDALTVVVTCRSDETPLDAGVADWLTHVRRDAEVEEIRLGPLSPGEVTEQVSGLVGAPPPAGLVEEVYARAEGHPFFTEQLVAAAVTDSGQRAQPVALPARLAELLVARTARCGNNGQAVLAALAVAGRPLTERLLGEVTGLDPPMVRTAVRELTAARLLAAPADGGHRLRHALLAEALAADLLPAERISLHERAARALQAAGDETLAAEAAGHWAAAGRPGEELRARVAAAGGAEHVFAYGDAATHWRRAIELCQAEPDADLGGGVDLPHLYIRAVDALEASGDPGRAEAVAEEAYRRYADHPDSATAALVHFRAGVYRGHYSPAAGLPLIQEALRLLEGTPPSAEQAWAWFRYARIFLEHGESRGQEDVVAALHRGLEIAEAVGAATLVPQILCGLADCAVYRGEVDEGFGLLAQAWSEPATSGDTWAVLELAGSESEALMRVGRLEAATDVGLRGVHAAQRGGLDSSFSAVVALGIAVEGLLGRGLTAEAAALITPRTTGPIDLNKWPLHQHRAEIDLLRGEVEAAAQRLQQIDLPAGLDFAGEFGQCVAEVALWADRPEEALGEVQRVLERLAGTDWLIFSGWLLAVGLRACADLAERGRARRDDDAVREALAAADSLTSWVEHEGEVPFTDHPYVASIPAARATWHAERGRAAGASDPVTWSTAAERWEGMDYRHRAAYARWRQAEALLAVPHGGRGAAATVLSTAAGLAVEHVPLTTGIQDLARRARIDLSTPAQPAQREQRAAAHPFGLTDRELGVLRLLGQGKTNPEIAAALFISPRTAGVHVTHILRKLDATTRVQAATIADRAGLLAAEPTRPGST